MKTYFFLFSVIMCLGNTACKKLSPDNYHPREFSRSLEYRVNATKPSPADSARGIFADSIIISPSHVIIETLEDINNLPYLNGTFSSGFSMNYENDNKVFPYFSVSFPSVPSDLTLNKIYEHSTSEDFNVPIFLGRSDGMDGWNYFPGNDYPPDAEQVRYSTGTKIVFTKRDEFVTTTNNHVVITDGSITGFVIHHYSSVPNKYVHRIDFSIKFEGLIVL